MNISVLTIALLAGTTFCEAAAPLTPTFFARHDYPWDQKFAISGDVNGDGIPDLVALLGGVVVYFGNGDGTFGPQVNTGVVAAGNVIAVRDVNGDGKADLLMPGTLNGVSGLIVCLSKGDGTFEPCTVYPQGVGSSDTLAVGDFNGDGVSDVIMPGESGGLWLFTGKRDGTFNAGVEAAPIAGGAYGIAAADLNGDGSLDVVVSLYYGGSESEGDGYVIAFGNGNGTFQSPVSFSSPQKVRAVAAGKLGVNGESGYAINFGSSLDLLVYIWNGSGGFLPPQHVLLPVSGGALAIGDINGDGIPDIVSAGAETYVALGNAQGTFDKPYEYPIQNGEGIWSLELADLRNDGRTDIITDATNGISVLLNEGNGEFEDGIWTKISGSAGCGVTADFNGDGKPDIAVNTGTGLQILLGTGKATKPFTVGETIALPAQPGCLDVSGDVNGDGIADLVVSAGTSVYTLLGNGDGTFRQAAATAADPAPYLVLADFNHDGKLDFATSANQIALGNGDGTFQAAQPIVASPPNGGFTGIAAGDINNDGWPDLVLTVDSVTAYFNVLVNNQAGGFVEEPQTFPGYTTSPVLADLNGDGFLDLITSNVVFLGNGKGEFTEQTKLGGGLGLADGSYSMVADINGDGIPDIVLLGYGTMEVDLGVGGTMYATPFYLGEGPASGFVFPAFLHGQRSTSGLPDLVLPDQSGGVLVEINETR